MRPSRSYHDDLIKDLKNPRVALGYLNAVLDENDQDAFLLALRYVAEAYGGMTKLSRISKMNRVNLYRMLKKDGNPELETLETILHALGFRLAIVFDKAA
jgi:probable addiction module antidote protein